MSTKLFSRYSLLVTIFALVVIVLGAFVRLSDAGLGCPDWPGCYGLIDVPKTSLEIEVAEQAFPQRPVEVSKAWKEMFHRYFAGTLGVLIVILAILSLRTRFESKTVPILSVSLVGLVVFQALLGMWTVTLQVKPAIVTLHLLFGMATVSLLWLTYLISSGGFSNAGSPSGLKGLSKLALLLVIGQIALGGWTSTNYAALACTAFPGCYTGDAWPDMDFAEAFVLWRGLGVNYEFGVLEPDARAAIHMTHRIGALVVLAIVGALGVLAIKNAQASQKTIAILILLLLGVQLMLGVLNVILSLPLANAVAHNGVAALLLLALIAYYHTEKRPLDQH
jgi:cytochrome c oxidase assembly protein subunit 15